MPTWAIVITQVIAVYGALLSTLNFLRAGPKLRFKAEPVARAPFLEPTADFVQTEVTNDGGRPTTLTSITIRYFDNQLVVGVVGASAEPRHKRSGILRSLSGAAPPV
jgi:hypothetical protein